MWRTEVAKYQVFFNFRRNIPGKYYRKDRLPTCSWKNEGHCFDIFTSLIISYPTKMITNGVTVLLNSTVDWMMWIFQFNLNEAMAWKGGKVWIEGNKWKASEAEFSFEMFLRYVALKIIYLVQMKWSKSSLTWSRGHSFLFNVDLKSRVLPIQIDFVRL